ncbi:MAG: patatin-like phospholipase family protein [Patescibacteria group bacterium]|nr:patatin-like phospholipase family protein [Patescibacteria group bacterium]
MIKRKKIGLALGSGGFRGLAHIGVIKVLEKNNIPIDYIAGSSIGALIGAFYASCLDIKKVEKTILEADWKTGLSILDFGKKGGLIKGKKLEKFINNFLTVNSFKELKIPLAVITTDINKCQKVILNAGNLIKAIRASFSAPLIFDPIYYQKRLLADGGLVDPVPDNEVKNMGADIILAVNIENGYFPHKLNFHKNISMIKLAMRSYNIVASSLAKLSMDQADIIIEPKVGGDRIVGLEKFFAQKNTKKLIKRGEEAAAAEINEIKKIL